MGGVAPGLYIWVGVAGALVGIPDVMFAKGGIVVPVSKGGGPVRVDVVEVEVVLDEDEPDVDEPDVVEPDVVVVLAVVWVVAGGGGSGVPGRVDAEGAGEFVELLFCRCCNR